MQRPGETARILALVILTSALLMGIVSAQTLPWQPAGGLPLGKQDVSIAFPFDDEPLFLTPDGSARRGAVRLGARLPIYATASSGGPCRNRWFMVGPSAWVCEDRVRLTAWVAVEANQRQVFKDGLPYAYHFVSEDGTFGYSNLGLAEEGIPDTQLEPGFAVGIRSTQPKPGGELFGLTTHGLWLPMRDLKPTRNSTFHGVEIKHQAALPGWVITDAPAVYSAPGRRLPTSQRSKLPRLTQFEVLERTTQRQREYLKYGENLWLRAADVRAMTRVDPAPEIGSEERWIDIDIAAQILTAYVGSSPIFSTLVSTGRGDDSSVEATPKGEHRIWVKLLSTDMTNLENDDADRYYAIEDVPYAMFFKGGYGIHAAFWHESFGRRRSHGCVNLSPLDAQFLFYWSGPRLPAGWRAALPTATDPGTRVFVR